MTKLAILRTKDKKEESLQLAQEMGFEVIFASPLELAEVDSAKFWQFVDDLESGKVDQVILINPTAVKFMLQLLNKKVRAEGAVRKLNQKGIIAIGPITADAAKREWIKVTAIPEKFTSDGLVQHLSAMVHPNDRVWVLRSDQGVEVITKGLKQLGAIIEEVAVYSLERTEPDRALLDIWYQTLDGRIDAYAFTSPLSAETFVHGGEERYGMRPFGIALNGHVIAAIGEPTRKTLQDMGFEVDVMPERATFKDLLLAIKEYLVKE